MEILKNYLDNIFLPYEENEKSIKLKNDILSHMEDEFEDLKFNGHSNEEAVGIIISKFGSFEDLLSELNFKNANSSIGQKLSVEDMETIGEYKEFSKKFPVYIAIGVVFCIMAVAISGVLKLYYYNDFPFIPIVFFSFIAIGVTLFIIAGVRNSYYINYFKAKGLTEYYDTEEYGMPFKDYEYSEKTEHIVDTIETIMWILIIATYLLLGFLKNLWHPGWIIFLIGAAISSVIELVIKYRKR